MPTRIELGGLVVDVLRKDIKNLHLSVYPPDGRVRIAAPERMTLEAIRAFAITKLAWIRRERRRFLAQERESPRECLDRESHFIWGRRCLLRIVERDGPAEVRVHARRLEMHVRAGLAGEQRLVLLDRWRREELRRAAAPLVATWERRLGVRVQRIFVQSMKTRWGSCNPIAGNIRLNPELTKKPPECLEYIVVHELVHLIEPSHGPAFVRIMDRHMPSWRERRATLNAAPLSHRDWIY
jgi:predicted metal-dependent hydrolase